MKHLLITTALAAALGVAGAQAQTQTQTPTQTPTQPATQAAAPVARPMPAITPPDGYVEADAVLTTDNLEDATVYDASGDQIGEVHGLVFANGTTTFQKGAAMPAADQPAAGETAAPMGDAMSTPNTGGTATDTASTNAESGTATGDNDRIKNVGSDSTTLTPTEALTPPTQQAGATAPQGAEISHAVIDVGGFLGMGAHRVAVPITDLVVYRKDTDLRIYLPWTKQQLMALPEFDENGPVPVQQ